MKKDVLLIKDYCVPHADHWQHHETRCARSVGHRAEYPKDVPGFSPGQRPYVKKFEKFILDFMRKQRLNPHNTVVLAHGLGGNGWLKVLQTRAEMRDCLTIFIGTPMYNNRGKEFDDFFPTTSLYATKAQRRNILVVGSDNDSVVRESPDVLAKHLAVEHLVIPGAGHFRPRASHRDRYEMDLGNEWRKVRGQIGRIYLPY